MSQEKKIVSQDLGEGDTPRFETKTCCIRTAPLTNQEKDFLKLLKEQRPILLARLQDLELLPSFLEVENGTKL